MGLPIGPDSSRVTAEIILTSVDAYYQGMFGSDGYLRHVDDFWIGGNSADDCAELLQALRHSLNEYSLDINELKTRVVPTSSIIAESWPYDLESQLEQVLSAAHPSRYESRIVALLGSVIERASAVQDDGIVKFFLRRIDLWHQWDTHWDILEPFLAHCAVQFAHSIDYVAQIVSWRIRTGREYDHGLWSDVTRTVIRSAASASRDAEALWGIWLAKELGLKLTEKSYNQMVASNGPMVVAALAHFAANGLIDAKVALAGLWSRVESSPLAGPEWPLALELHHLEAKKPKHIEINGAPALKSIFDAGASLIEWAAYPRAFVNEDDEIGEIPDAALEDSSGYYDDDDDEELEPLF